MAERKQKLKLSFTELVKPSVTIENDFDISRVVKERAGMPLDNSEVVDTLLAFNNHFDAILEKRAPFIRESVRASLK